MESGGRRGLVAGSLFELLVLAQQARNLSGFQLSKVLAGHGHRQAGSYDNFCYFCRLLLLLLLAANQAKLIDMAN